MSRHLADSGIPERERVATTGAASGFPGSARMLLTGSFVVHR
ncbi:hypothetical protein [Saccharomonospora viridis]|uniref:Uncharacterized protein n=2 Tax=Saccharomonospora viridis TaxID=1852 RepID=C7MQL4_SACVD|nr:hypothetical protein [Saccharomonospora viridis]ACU98541.1 hypothetical protein Svir_35860 [Saccharomonospora viridis DSM 43017]KHF44335.1 hypothetical protein MINT15_12170 [Saccharomonospora viridis]